jgi:hypothetical protein
MEAYRMGLGTAWLSACFLFHPKVNCTFKNWNGGFKLSRLNIINLLHIRSPNTWTALAINCSTSYFHSHFHRLSPSLFLSLSLLDPRLPGRKKKKRDGCMASNRVSGTNRHRVAPLRVAWYDGLLMMASPVPRAISYYKSIQQLTQASSSSVSQTPKSRCCRSIFSRLLICLLSVSVLGLREDCTYPFTD